MIVISKITLNKKRMAFLLLTILLPVGIFTVNNIISNMTNNMTSNIISNVTNNMINNNSSISRKTVETMATPASNKTIVVDAGHGGEDRAGQLAIME